MKTMLNTTGLLPQYLPSRPRRLQIVVDSVGLQPVHRYAVLAINASARESVVNQAFS
jgi:hypothetical protein